VAPYVQRYLDAIPKKAPVCFQTTDGKITKIWEDKEQPAQQPQQQEQKKETARPQESPAEVLPAVVIPAHPVIVAKTYSEDEMLLLRNVIAKGCSEPEFKLLMYMANTYGLDPLLKQIWAVKRTEGQPALIFAGRDGMLAIAHRSGHFDGMQSGVNYEKKTIDSGKATERTVDVPVSAWCEIWRNDMTHSFKTEVPFSEYNTGYSVWKTNPSAMILKVAEAVCLRKAFSVSGLYSPEEISERA
jgi:phage recombination protein Bet